MTGLLTTTSESRRFSQAIQFDPVFNPASGRERKQWERIHGRRQQ
jgi:hypothetical protein